MYKAKFAWKQNTKFPIYKRVIEPYLDSGGPIGTGIFEPAMSAELEPVEVRLDINEDFTYEIQSNFQGYAEAMGSVSSIAGSILGFFEKLNTLSAMGGKASSASEFMKFQVWKETEPFRMSFKFLLETKTDPFVDVYAPAIALSSMAILSPVGKGDNVSFYTPGVNSGGMKALSRDNQTGVKENKSGKQKSGNTTKGNKENKPSKALTAAWGKNSKLLDSFSIIASRVDGSTIDINSPQPDQGESQDGEIPLLIINNAFIKTCKPLWSKDRTASGIPVRCELELQIESVFSANDAMFGWLKKSNTTSFGDVASVVATNVFR